MYPVIAIQTREKCWCRLYCTPLFSPQPADTELLKLYAEIEKDGESARRIVESAGTVHASLAMALSSVGGGGGMGPGGLDEDDRELTMEELMAKTGARPSVATVGLKRAFVAHTSVPSQKEVEEALVEKRKRQLLEQYMTPEFMESVEATGKLLGVDQPTAAAGSGDVEFDEDEGGGGDGGSEKEAEGVQSDAADSADVQS